jgi:hypothetical protein
MHRSELVLEVKALLAAITGNLHPASLEMVSELVEVGELKIAVETLCEHLNDLRLSLEGPTYSKLMSIVTALELDDVYQSMVPLPRIRPNPGVG